MTPPTVRQAAVIPIRRAEPDMAADAPPSSIIPGPRALPYPNGWFALCFSHELKPGDVRIAPFMGSDLVLYRTRSGVAHAITPYCPHLGAHLGHGGKVDGENLVCPFHGLSYGPDGACTHAPRDRPPPRASLEKWPLQERNGAIVVWRHHAGQAPESELPEIDMTGFSRPRGNAHDQGGYAHDLVENLSDFVHFDHLHGVANAAMTHEIRDNQLVLRMTGRWYGTPITVDSTAYGLGFMVGRSHMPKFGLTVIHRAFATPTGPLTWTFRWTDSLHVSGFDALPGPLRKLLQEMCIGVMHRLWAGVVAQDYAIWRHRRYDERAKLMGAEAPVAACRRWMAQFYPTPTLQ
ncbi:Rieske-like 2Fe-2S protein [Variovorax sp. 54]|uniref:Rieske 2Fe-2S domain-containing protein n=1 Tax=Variovorax sp. 54 TaxID=2035212 RepID=UPI000C18FA56|nr:Rieske 2Fe-2S domain-containing protein [Variovorax sp. 54]PIF75320.1 Rieske-like 2Fe-2S protein [Variovorax sp. 54]